MGDQALLSAGLRHVRLLRLVRRQQKIEHLLASETAKAKADACCK